MSEPTTGKLRAGLKELQKRGGKPTKLDRLRPLQGDIELSLAAGVTYEAIAARFTRDGLPISAPTLKTYMARLRAAKRSGG